MSEHTEDDHPARGKKTSWSNCNYCGLSENAGIELNWAYKCAPNVKSINIKCIDGDL